jgi:hypothetical protein
VKTELALLMTYERPTMTLEQVAELMEITPRSLENQHYERRCPVPLFKVGARLQAHIADVATYIDTQRAAALELLQQPRKAA